MSDYQEPPDVAEPFRKKKRGKRNFGVEYKHLRIHFAAVPHTYSWEWAIWKWYDTEKKRDTALRGLLKSQCAIYKYRSVRLNLDPDEPPFRKIDK